METDRQTDISDKDTDRETNKQILTDRQAHTHTHTHTQTHSHTLPILNYIICIPSGDTIAALMKYFSTV